MIVHEDLLEKRNSIGMENNVLGWVHLVDQLGYVRWSAHGIATEKELATLSTLTKRLLGFRPN